MAVKNAGYEVVWPRGKRSSEVAPFAQRLNTLEGKTVGELWNWKFHGEVIFPAIEEELARRYPRIKFVSYNVFGSTSGPKEKEAEVFVALPDKLKQNKCDAVISGVGC